MVKKPNREKDNILTIKQRSPLSACTALKKTKAKTSDQLFVLYYI